MATEKRIEYIDFIKGICIFIVVWGHSIQNMGDGNEFWTNPVHEFICSFHMPIFMMVSGFFFSKFSGKPLPQSLGRRFKQLIVPCFGWSLVLVAINIGYMLYDGISPSPVDTVKSIIQETFTRFWFLRSVFICFTLALVSMKIFKKDWVAFIVSLVLFLALPDNGRIHFDKFMYPFFWMGYFVHKHIDSIMRHRNQLLVSSALAFVVLLFFYCKEAYIYITGMSLYDYRGGQWVFYPISERLLVISYRYLIGFIGSLAVFLFLQRIYRPGYRAIEKVGTYTLGIYTIHILIEGNILQRFNLLNTGFFMFNFIITPVISVLLIVLCIGIIKVLEKNNFSSLLFLGKTKLYLGLIILCLFSTSCVKQINLYQGDKEIEENEENNGGDDTKPSQREDVISETDFFYPFADETPSKIAEITIHTRTPLQDVDATIPVLKFNKSWLLMLTQDDCKQAAFSSTWAAINGKPLSSSYFYDLAHLKYGDLPPDIHYLGKTLGSTDGTGNEVRFSFTTTLSPEWEWMDNKTQIYKGNTNEYYRFFMRDGLVWGNVKEMLNYGVGIAMHDMNVSDDEINSANLVEHYAIAQNIIKNKLAGRGCKLLTKPSGKQEYITAGQEYADIQTMAAEDGATLYPAKIHSDLNKAVLNRGFYPIDHLKAEIEKQLQRDFNDRTAVYVGVHGTDDTWADFLLWLNNEYGKDGADNVWMPNHEEFYEYNYYRTNSTIHLNKIDDYTLKMVIYLTGKEHFYYPSVTINLSQILKEEITSIETNDDITGMSYTDYKDGIMINIDCRKHLAEHAENFVKRYEADRSDDSNKADALYFVNMLKESDKKESLLKRLQ